MLKDKSIEDSDKPTIDSQNSANRLTISAIVASIILTGIGIWVNSIQDTVNEVISLKPQIERIRKDVNDNTEWQKEWQRSGELPADVKQSKDIEYLKSNVFKLEGQLEDLMKQIHLLEIEQVKKR